MSQDISKDPRILIVEYAINRLNELTVNKKYKLPASKEKTIEAINKIKSAIKNIKYSYIPPLELIDKKEVLELELMANQFWDAIVKNNQDIDKTKLINSELRFIFNILKGFRDRLRLGNEATIDNAIDIIAVRIVTILKLDKTENLYLTKVGNGKRIMTIITNLKSIKKDMVLPAAILPPKIFGTVVSEAMFVSSSDLSDMHDKVGSRVINLSADRLKEVNHLVLDMIKNIK
ncbi:MAG: hypothetical protein ACTSPY_09280 [Candidatus Helarchaeota archaeon]